MSELRLNIGRNGEKKQAREIEYLFAEKQWVLCWLIPSLRDQPPGVKSLSSSTEIGTGLEEVSEPQITNP